MPFVPLNQFDREKVAYELVRQLRRHGALDAFIEMASMDLKELVAGDQALLEDWVTVPALKLAWGTNGSRPLYHLLQDDMFTKEGWGATLPFVKQALDDRDPSSLHRSLRTRRRTGAVVEIEAKDSVPTLVAAAACLCTNLGPVSVSDRGVTVSSRSAFWTNLEVCDDYVRLNERYYEGLGPVRWDLMAPGTRPVAIPKALSAIVTDALMVDDPMVTALLAAYTLSLVEDIPKADRKAWRLQLAAPRLPFSRRPPEPQPTARLADLSPEQAYSKIVKSLVPKLQEWAGVHYLMDYLEANPNADYDMPPQPADGTEGMVYETLKMADAKYIGQYIKGLPDKEEVSVNLLELFNFYVAMYHYQTPTGFRKLTRHPAIVNHKANVIRVTVSRLKRWHLALHDTSEIMERC